MRLKSLREDENDSFALSTLIGVDCGAQLEKS